MFRVALCLNACFTDGMLKLKQSVTFLFNAGFDHKKIKLCALKNANGKKTTQIWIFVKFAGSLQVCSQQFSETATTFLFLRHAECYSYLTEGSV